MSRLPNGRSLGVEDASKATRDDYEFLGFPKSECGFTIEKKAHGEDRMMFEGYASVFGNIDSYNDIIDKGAFTTTLKERGPKTDAKGVTTSLIKSLWQHNPDWPFGLPLEAEEDSKGLHHRTMISNTAENRDRVEYMTDGVVSTQSIGFITMEAELEDEEDYWSVRHIRDVMLYEWSPVTFAANEEAITETVLKSRALALAVKESDHGKVLKLARKMNGIFVPEIETAISVLTRLTKDMDLSGEESPETSSDDPDLVKELERFAGTLSYDPHEDHESCIDLTDTILKADEEGYTANSKMKPPARQALKWKEDGKPGGTAVGIKRAHQIVDGESMSYSTVKRVKSFFDRHQGDKDATGFNSGEDGYPSKGRVAWNLWGGDPGWTWATGIVEKIEGKEALVAEFEAKGLTYYSSEEVEAITKSREESDEDEGADGVGGEEDGADDEWKSAIESFEFSQELSFRSFEDRLTTNGRGD